MNLQPGQLLDDRYVLIARLGKGGQGEVWSVEDSLKPGTPRAVKLMSVARVDTVRVERVRREAKQLVQLEHPSLVACHGLFEDVRQEVMGIVMDYVEGESLETLVGDPRLTEEHRLAVLGHVAGVLAYVHHRAVVHRDIKLQNILICRDFWANPRAPQHLKMIDFGIAASSGNPEPLTLLGRAIGTPGYMPPEVVDPDYWRAERSRPAGDVFAWGVLAWRLLMKGHPSGLAKGTMPELAAAYRHIHETGGAWPPGLPPARWAGVVARALALEAARRPQDGYALVELLRQQSPEWTSSAVPHATRTPTPVRKADGLDAPPTILDAVPRPSDVPTVADEGLVGTEEGPSLSTPATAEGTPAVADPAAPTSPTPLHLEPTVFAPAPPSTACGEGNASPPSSQVRSKGRLAIALASASAVVGLVFIGLAVALVVMRGRTPSAVETQSAAGRPQPRAEHGRRTASAASNCASGVACEPNCGDLLDAAAEFELRFTYVQIRGAAIQNRYPEAEVCTQVTGTAGPRICTQVADARLHRFAPDYLTVRHTDLAERGLDITVRERPGGTVLAQAHAARPKQGVIKRTALCRGYVVPGPFTGKESVLHATYYIHPVGSPAAR